MNTRFKGSTVTGSADRGSCYPARCAEALSASTHQGKHYLPHPRGKHYLPQPRSDGALTCKAHVDTFRYNCTSIVSAQLPSSAFSFLASIFVSVYLLPGPSSSPRRKHFLPLRHPALRAWPQFSSISIPVHGHASAASVGRATMVTKLSA